MIEAYNISKEVEEINKLNKSLEGYERESSILREELKIKLLDLDTKYNTLKVKGDISRNNLSIKEKIKDFLFSIYEEISEVEEFISNKDLDELEKFLGKYGIDWDFFDESFKKENCKIEVNVKNDITYYSLEAYSRCYEEDICLISFAKTEDFDCSVFVNVFNKTILNLKRKEEVEWQKEEAEEYQLYLKLKEKFEGI